MSVRLSNAKKMEQRNISLRNRCPKGKLKLTSFQIGGVQEFVMNFVCVIHRLAFEYRRKKKQEEKNETGNGIVTNSSFEFHTDM